MEFPQVDLPVDMIAWTEVTEDILNIYKQSCRLKACIFALCIEGSITVSINLMDTEIKQGDFITRPRMRPVSHLICRDFLLCRTIARHDIISRITTRQTDR